MVPAGALVFSFNALEQYYQDQGRDWERYAMIKARVVAGDQAAGAQLQEMLRPFVYRRYLDFSAIEALRSMKQLIQQEVARRRRHPRGGGHQQQPRRPRRSAKHAQCQRCSWRLLAVG